jgi:cobalt/nickel transport system permease protein
MSPPGHKQESSFSNVPAGAKLGATLVMVGSVTLMPRTVTPAYFIPAAVLLFLWAFSRMPVRYGFKRMLVAEFFIIGIAFMSLLSPGARPVFFAALIKSNLCVLCVVLLTWTTPFTEILATLRRLRVPPLMLTTLALMVRYLPVLGAEARRMERARASRTFTRGRWLTWRSLGEVISRLFVRSADRAERIYLAMCARGWK